MLKSATQAKGLDLWKSLYNFDQAGWIRLPEQIRVDCTQLDHEVAREHGGSTV